MRTSKLVLTRALTILIVLMLFVSCSREDEKTAAKGQPESQVVNEYTNESVFEKVLRQVRENPDNVDSLNHLAELYFNSSMYEKAVETYRHIVELDPEKGYAYFKMGTAYSRMNQPAEAIAALSKAAELLPRPAYAFNNLGMAYTKVGDMAKAAGAFEQAIENRSRYAAARYNLARLYIKQGELAPAIEQYRAIDTFDGTAAENLKKEILQSFPQAAEHFEKDQNGPGK